MSLPDYTIYAIGIFILGIGGMPSPKQEANMVTLGQAAVAVLQQDHAPGGIEVGVGCSAQISQTISARGTTTVEKLTSLQDTDPTMRWRKVSSGYLVRIGPGESASLMQVPLPAVTISLTNAKSDIDQLFDRGEIQQDIEKTHLKLFESPLGYSSVKVENHEQKDVRLPAGTVADDLELIMENYKDRVWMYTHSDCKGSHAGRILLY